eukprot:CAMPEP_0119325044 /NCGR_PEP_ID=MMETSP1333-20130426/64853_1 /TAXON_ID=418940 /ORGANISM="Scyphosphaera apsteinii, Strain RCC1455" /LENGTH=261 /DNA_ID=CAMNT_0007332913 /DNA_START=25 /DNA_END=807 /DNA_ORIENTATION=+
MPAMIDHAWAALDLETKAYRELGTTLAEISEASELDWSSKLRGRGNTLSDSKVHLLVFQTNEINVAVAQLLPSCTKLTKINLADNHFGFAGPEDIDALADAFIKTPSLRDVNISDQKLTTFGKDMVSVTRLWEALPSTNITRLDVSKNNLTNFGNEFSAAIRLFELLPSTKLTHLNVADNYISNNRKNLSAVNMLADMLPSSNITHLDLARNRIGDEAATKLAEAFAQMENLKVVNLSGNKCDTAIQEKVCKAAPGVQIEW